MEELSAGSNLLSEQVDDPAAAGGADLLSLFQVSGLSAYVSAAAGRTSGALAGRERVKRHKPRQGRSVLRDGTVQADKSALEDGILPMTQSLNERRTYCSSSDVQQRQQ